MGDLQRAMSRRFNGIRSILMMVLALATALAGVSADAQRNSEPLTSLRAIHALSNSEASHRYSASFEATVTYYRPYERTMFVQDGDYAIYVQPKRSEERRVGEEGR